MSQIPATPDPVAGDGARSELYQVSYAAADETWESSTCVRRERLFFFAAQRLQSLRVIYKDSFSAGSDEAQLGPSR